MGAAHPVGIGLAEGWGVGWGQWRERGSAFRGGDRASRGCLMAPGVRAHLWLRDAVVTNGITRRWSRPLAALASAQRQGRSAHRDRRKAPRPPLSIPTAKRQEDHRCY